MFIATTLLISAKSNTLYHIGVKMHVGWVWETPPPAYCARGGKGIRWDIKEWEGRVLWVPLITSACIVYLRSASVNLGGDCASLPVQSKLTGARDQLG
jgi:hypothetical protein